MLHTHTQSVVKKLSCFWWSTLDCARLAGWLANVQHPIKAASAAAGRLLVAVRLLSFLTIIMIYLTILHGIKFYDISSNCIIYDSRRLFPFQLNVFYVLLSKIISLHYKLAVLAAAVTALRVALE